MAAIQSLTRAFEILRAVAGCAEGRPLSEIARQVDLPKSTVSRMLATLEQIGAVERVHQPEGFRIGAAIMALAAQTSYPRGLVAVARPYLQTLVQNAGETVALAIPDGDQVYYLDQIDGWHNLRLKNWTNHRLPLHATADGKLYLAYSTPASLERYLQQPLSAYTTHTITDPDRLRAELVQIRQQGYAWNQQEYDPDLVSLAAPLRDDVGQLVASICLFGPSFRFPPPEQRQAIIDLVVTTAQQISSRLQSLGQQVHYPLTSSRA